MDYVLIETDPHLPGWSNTRATLKSVTWIEAQTAALEMMLLDEYCAVRVELAPLEETDGR